MGTGKVSTGAPGRLRSFDPVRIADLEYRMWVGYYQQRWTQVLAAAVRLAWLGFGTDWVRTLQDAAEPGTGGAAGSVSAVCRLVRAGPRGRAFQAGPGVLGGLPDRETFGPMRGRAGCDRGSISKLDVQRHHTEVVNSGHVRQPRRY